MNQKGIAPLIAILVVALIGAGFFVARPYVNNIIQNKSFPLSSPTPIDVSKTSLTPIPTSVETPKATPTPQASVAPKPTTTTLKTPTVTLDPVDHSFVVTARRGEKVRVTSVSSYKSDTVTNMNFPNSGAPAGATWSFEPTSNGANIFLTVGSSAAIGKTKWSQVWQTTWASGKSDNLFLTTNLSVIN